MCFDCTISTCILYLISDVHICIIISKHIIIYSTQATLRYQSAICQNKANGLEQPQQLNLNPRHKTTISKTIFPIRKHLTQWGNQYTLQHPSPSSKTREKTQEKKIITAMYPRAPNPIKPSPETKQGVNTQFLATGMTKTGDKITNDQIRTRQHML